MKGLLLLAVAFLAIVSSVIGHSHFAKLSMTKVHPLCKVTECPAQDHYECTVHLPHRDCTKYYTCLAGNKIEMDCPFMDAAKTKRLHFNAKEQVCDLPALAGCRPYSEEILTSHEFDSTRYYRELNGVKTMEKCPEGLHFNAKEQMCVSSKDVKGKDKIISIRPKDPPKKCPLKGTILLPHESNCEWYYNCVHGKRIQTECTNGKHFSYHHQKCLPPGKARCVPSTPNPIHPPVSAPSDCPSTGELLLPHECNCGLFYSCSNGKGTPESCPVGKHFAYKTQNCLPPGEANCFPGKPEPTPPPVAIPKDPPADCPSTGSLLLPHECNCGLYYSCSNGKGTPESCPAGKHFAYKTQNCLPPGEANCFPGKPEPTPPPVTIPKDPPADCPSTGSLLLPHECNCGLYYSCSNGKGTPESCPVGKHFAYKSQNCLPPGEANCFPSVPTPTPLPDKIPTNPPADCPSTGSLLLPHECNCGLYYSCSNGKGTPESCPVGKHFAYKSQNCLPPGEANCFPSVPTPIPPPDNIPTNPPADCPSSGSLLLPHECNCGLYYSCSGGKGTPESCPAGLHFAYKTQNCLPPGEANCFPDNNNPPPDPPADCPSSGKLLLPHECNCGLYYSCSDGKGTPESCPAGLHFAYKTQNCLPPGEANCFPDNKPPLDPPADCPSSGKLLLPHECNCGLYYSCSDGKGTKEYCPAGLHFAYKSQNCLPPGEANCFPSSKMCKVKPYLKPKDPPKECPLRGSILLPHERNCEWYYNCVDGRRIKTECTNGNHFTYLHQKCLSPAAANCSIASNPNSARKPTNPPKGCPPKDTILLPHESNCESYYNCVHGRRILTECSGGNHFVYSLQKCLPPKEANCSIASNTNSARKPTNPPKECPPEGTILLPHESNCEAYYSCVHGRRILTECSGGNHFVYSLQKCLPPKEANCSPDTPEPTPSPNPIPKDPPTECPLKGTILLPHECNCQLYYSCSNGKGKLVSCPTGEYFSYSVQKCIPQEESNCKPTYNCISE